jgi:hypothetical protein
VISDAPKPSATIALLAGYREQADRVHEMLRIGTFDKMPKKARRELVRHLATSLDIVASNAAEQHAATLEHLAARERRMADGISAATSVLGLRDSITAFLAEIRDCHAIGPERIDACVAAVERHFAAVPAPAPVDAIGETSGSA